MKHGVPTMTYILRRMRRDSAVGGHDIWWLLFHVGEIKNPICVLSDIDMDNLIEQVESERGELAES